MNKDSLRSSVEEAKKMLTLAEEDLTRALNALEAGARPNKMIASQAIEDAFVKLRVAKADVLKLVALLNSDTADA